MKIEAGQKYVDRSGAVRGPIVRRGGVYPWTDGENTWDRDGFYFGSNVPDDADLVAAFAPSAPLAKSATEPRFKPGDKVRFTDVCTHEHYWMGPHGEYKTGIVVGHDERYGWEVHVPEKPDVGTMYFTNAEIEPFIEQPGAASTSNTYIVCLMVDGAPRPSVRPFVHKSRAAAEKEAARLARKYRGKEFTVFSQATTSVRNAFNHEWQEDAWNGRMSPAVISMCRLTGLGPQSARAAIDDWLARQRAA